MFYFCFGPVINDFEIIFEINLFLDYQFFHFVEWVKLENLMKTYDVFPSILKTL